MHDFAEILLSIYDLYAINPNIKNSIALSYNVHA